MADLAVKTEIRPEIKVEAAEDTPNDPADSAEQKDEGVLKIPDAPPQGSQAWLVNLPKYIWKAWNDIYKNLPDGNEPVQIGQMRVFNSKPGENEMKQKIQIRLAPGVPQHVELPKNYDLHLKTIGYSNVAVFSEKDLPGHKNRPFGKRSTLAARKPNGLQSKSERYGETKPGTYRSVIPKETELAPLIYHVADAAPVEDESYYEHFRKTYLAETKPKHTTKYHAGIDRGLHPGANLGTFASFNMSSHPGGKGKKKIPKEKAVRMPADALLDAIYACFRRYKYWSLKALRNELKQPEAYIKSTLDDIATLVRSGDFAMNYILRPEYSSVAKVNDDDVKEETALIKSEVEVTDAGTGDEMRDDEDEDMSDFEDVKMDGGDG